MAKYTLEVEIENELIEFLRNNVDDADEPDEILIAKMFELWHDVLKIVIGSKVPAQIKNTK